MNETVYEIDDFCKHMRHLYNQGVHWCEIDGDMSDNCKNCTLREPENHKIKITTS